VIDALNRPWIALPIFFALTVAGLIAGFRHGGVSLERGVVRAFLLGLPMMLGLWLLWDLIIEVCQARGAPGQFDGLDLLLGFVFFPCSSALAGVTLARRKRMSPVERGTVIIDVRGREPATPRPGELTLAGQLLAPVDETKHFKIIGTTGTGKSTAIRELLARAVARGDRAIIADPDGSYARHFYDPARGDVILNPFDRRAARWDLFAEIIEPHDADHLARSLIPDYDGTTGIGAATPAPF
jgi:Type IV secretion-system coupling protein DNA-binding domain